MSTGFVLNIPQEMLSRLEDADKKIEKLAKTSKDAQTRIVSAFKSMSTNGVDAFITKINEVQSKLSQLGNTQINIGANTGAFTGLTSQAQNVIDEVNRIVTAMGKVKKAAGDTGMAKNPFAGMTESLKQWNNLQSQIDATDAKIKKLTSTTMDYERQMQRMRSGQTTPMNISYNEYAYTKERIAALQEEKRVLREKQEEITRQNNALSEQVRIQESLKRFVANQDSLPNRRSRDDYENLRRQLAEEEKASEKAEQKRVKDVEKAEKEAAKIREAERKKREKEEKATADRIAAYDSKARKERYKAYTSTYEGAMRTSDRAKTLLQEQQAIKNLEAARAKLNKTDSDYANKLRNLNQRILEHKNNIDKATEGSKNLQTQHRSLMDISGQLARKLALVFSVSQITGYVKKLIEVRGEFELQQRSLQAILQNKDEANRIWQQTVDLAVRSPFRVKELVSYTKQLAAYRIESDKLFETNKMLADISAGLGVDMQRLILAFGQVRSAAYLRGTELRQFTEAGIPILEQLAQYFTELEGRAVSVGDVFERVSKRMVSFADVEEIFKRMTSEGGTFYRMQEIQAETLQGQISNLKDSVDIMLNDIGKAHQDTLASSVSFVRSVVQNWRLLATAIQQAGFALAGFSAVKIIRALRLTGDALVEATVKTKGLTAATAKLKLSMMDLGKWIKANPYLLVAGLIASAAHALVQYGKSVDAMNEKYDEMSQRELRRVDTLKQLNEQVEKNNQAIKDAIAEQDNASEGTDEYATAEENLSRARGKNISLLERLKKEYPEVYASITKQEDGTVDLTKAIEEQNKVAQRQIALQQQAKGGFFQQDFSTNYEDAVEAFGKYQAALEDVRAQAYVTHQDLLNALNVGDISQESFDSIVGFIDQLKSAKDLTSVREILKQINATIGGSDELSFKFVSNIQKATQGLSDAFVDYSVSLKNFRANILPMTSTIGNEVRERLLDPERGEESAKEYIDGVLDQFGVLNKEVRLWARDEIVKIINVDLVWGEGSSVGGDEELDGWAKRVKEAVDALNEEIKKKSPKIDTDDLFPVPNKNQTKEEYLAVAKDAIGVAEMTYDELQKIEDQEVVDRTKALSPFVETFRKILNLYKETTKGGGDKDTFTPMLRTVKEIYQEFKKLQGSFDDLTAKEGALAKFGDAFKEAFGKTPEQMGFDLFSEEGVKKAYDYLISKAPDAKKKIQAQLAKGEIVWDVKLQTKKDADKELLDDIQELFDRYDLSLELKKLNIPPDLAKSLFDVDYLDLDGLKKAVQEQEAKFIGTDMEDEYKKFLDKIDDMGNKAAKERMKTYVEYARSAIGERAKIKLEELKKLKEIEETFAEKESDSEETKKYKREQKQLASEKAQKESSDAMQKLEWEDFQKSDMFINIFEDLDGASDALLNHMIQKLQEFKSEWTDMPLEDMKKIVDKINELQMALVENNPWEAYKKSKEAVKDAMKGATFESEEAKSTFGDGKSQSAFMQALQLENVYQEQKKLNAQEELGYLETALRIKEGQATEEEKILEKQEDYNKYLRMSPAELKKQIAAQKTIVKNADGILVANEEILSESQKQAKALLKQADNLGKAQQMANDLYDAFKGLAEALGADSDSPAAIFADMGMNMLNTVLSTIQLQIQLNAATVAANGLGIAMNTAMGVVGWIVMAIQLVAQAITAIVNYADKQKEKEIERLAKRVEDLREKFEDLNEAIDEAWSTSQLTTYKNELDQTYKMAIAAQKAIVAARADEKEVRNGKTDSEEYKQWEEAKKELEELEQEYAESTQNIYSKVTDGILDSVHDAAREFTDAWWDAFIETGDGLSGLEENFNEMFLNLAKNQAAMQITGAFADRWKKDLEKYINADDTELTKDEAKKWAEEVRRTMPELSEALEGYLGAFKDMATAEGAGLSGLTKGIQGVSESTAQVLESLLNSMRFYVADSNSKLGLLLQSMGVSTIENPQLVELRTQTMVLNEINAKIASLNETVGGLIVNDRLKVTATTQLDQLIRPRANGGVGLNIVND